MPLYVNFPSDITTSIAVFSSFAFHAPALNVSMYLPSLRLIAGVVAVPLALLVPNIAHLSAPLTFLSVHPELSHIRVGFFDILFHIPLLPPVPLF